MNNLRIIDVKFSNNKKTCIISFDSNEQYTFAVDLVIQNKLSKNKTISSEELANLIFQQKIIEAKNAALKYFSYKPRTTFEIEDKLRKMGYDEGIVQKVIAFLVDFGYLDDLSFAEKYSDYLLNKKRVSFRNAKNALKRKGINPTIIEQALVNLSHQEIELHNALEIAKKKYRQLINLKKDKVEERLAKFLLGKGFSYEVIKNVIKNLR
ncbi:MAG: RecX family transcriptional regulator [Ignavibacteria bacterium]|nr:RecX family transcriptional regulator [Ignavibacteria bacterium]